MAKAPGNEPLLLQIPVRALTTQSIAHWTHANNGGLRLRRDVQVALAHLAALTTMGNQNLNPNAAGAMDEDEDVDVAATTGHQRNRV